MGMGIVSDKDFDSELVNTKAISIPPTTPKSATVIDVPSAGRNEGDVNVPNSLRNIIGDTAVTDGRQEAIALAKSFGISPSSVSAYSNGATSTASMDRTPNSPVINKAKIRVQSRARKTLMAALDGITPDKLAESKARDLAGIAKDMATIYKSMEPEDTESSKAGQQLPQFVVYAPTFRDERSFDTIYAKE